MVTWPQFQEQFYNEKLLVQILRIGVSVGAQNVVHLGEEEKSGVMVTSAELTKAIEMVMGDGKESEDRRKRAKTLGKIANEAIEEEGSSYRNITRLIQVVARKEETIEEKGGRHRLQREGDEIPPHLPRLHHSALP
ncbi:hypothetical protein QVD17_04481 [Tagetes erecta]|uniref:Uncharacterized protein n=1 Tax=Tagetes erecta TaxID=13708 RepID=A0AAD8LGS0_TARER|nr:hypothetical protein QVD17_04481 [Tagetes erecta]